MPFSSLTILPGVVIEASENARMIAFGELFITGDETTPVDIGSNGQPWKGIEVRYSNAQISHTKIRHAEVAINCVDSDLVAESVTTKHVRNIAIRGRGRGRVTVSKCYLHSVEQAENININVVSIRRGCELVMENSILVCPKKAMKIDAVDLGNCSFSSIKGNVLIGSPLQDTDALDIDDSSTNIDLVGNLILDFADKAISVGESSSCSVRENVFLRCGTGLAVKDGAQVKANNNTYIDLETGISCYVKIPRDVPTQVVADDELFVRTRIIEITDGRSSIIKNNNFASDAKNPLLDFYDAEKWDFRLVDNNEKKFGAEKDFSKSKIIVNQLLAYEKDRI
jgi:hypothetical protein